MSIPYIFAEFSNFSNYEALIYPKKKQQTNKQKKKKQTHNFKVMVNRISKILRF